MRLSFPRMPSVSSLSILGPAGPSVARMRTAVCAQSRVDAPSRAWEHPPPTVQSAAMRTLDTGPGQWDQRWFRFAALLPVLSVVAGRFGSPPNVADVLESGTKPCAQTVYLQLLSLACGSGFAVSCLDLNLSDVHPQAAYKGHTEVCRWLLGEVRSDPCLKDEGGYTPSAIAKLQHHAELAELLLLAERRAGGDPGRGDDTGHDGYTMEGPLGVLRKGS